MKRTAKNLWVEGSNSLKGVSENPTLDSLLLLCYVLKINKEEYWRETSQEVNPDQVLKFRSLISLRAQREPVAYLIKEKEFWGKKFFVDRRVLIPRPDTEILVETALEIIKNYPSISSIYDVGTGSGVIGLSVCANSHSFAQTHLIDISQDALNVAQINQHRLCLPKVTTHLGNLLSPWEKIPPHSLILANLPYLTKEEIRKKEALYPSEPHLSLLGRGKQGTGLIEELLDQIREKKESPIWIVLEASSRQIPLISYKMREKGFIHVKTRQDLSGRDRIILSLL